MNTIHLQYPEAARVEIEQRLRAAAACRRGRLAGPSRRRSIVRLVRAA